MTLSADTALPPRKRREKRPAVFCPECGVILIGEDKERSTPQHRRLFAVVKAAFANWPEKHEFKPGNIREMRAWLVCRAGHYDTMDATAATDPTQAWRLIPTIASWAGGKPIFTKTHRGRLLVYKAKSISYDELGHSAACALFRDIEDVVFTEAGIRLPPKEQQ